MPDEPPVMTQMRAVHFCPLCGQPFLVEDRAAACRDSHVQRSTRAFFEEWPPTEGEVSEP